MKTTLSFRNGLIAKVLLNVWQERPINLSATQKKMLLLSIFLTNVLITSFAQKTTGLLSTYDSCHVQPPQQTAFALEALSVGSPMVRVAYVIPSNRTPQPNGVANLQYAIKAGRQFFKEQMEQSGFGPKTFVFETEDDGVTPLIHVVHVAETDEYLRGDIWGRTQAAASNAGISLWAPGEVWVVIPETYLMFADGSGAGGVALGGGSGSGNGGGVSMIGSNALPLFNPAMITDDTPYDGKVLPELGPYPMKQDVTFAWFEGTTFSSVASSWLGALWHETGHAFGLGHDFRNDSNFHGNLMGNGLRGTRGNLFPEKYPQDYTRLEYVAALLLNVSHFFNRDKTGTCCPTVSATNPPSVTPQQGLVHISFQASDPDGLSFAYLIEVKEGDLAGEMLLDGTTAEATFAVPYFRPGDTNPYNIFVLDKQGHKAGVGVQFNVPAGYNQAPHPHIRITPPVPTLDQRITLDATLSWDAEHDLSSILSTWDINNDGQFDTEPSTNKIVPYTYASPGNYLVRLKMTDPAGGETISTPVSIKIPGEKKITVESFTLIDADKDEAVRELEDGLIINQTAWEGKKFSVRANTSTGVIDRVEFDLEGPIIHHQVDSEPPYALFGDAQGDFIGRKLLPGEYTLTATPFSSSEGGVALTLSFRVRETSVEVSDKTIGGTGEDILFSSALSMPDGGYMLAGRSSSNASGDKSENSRGSDDYWIVKTDAQYYKLWDKTFGGNGGDGLQNIVATSDGGWLLVGNSNSDISGDKSENSKGSTDYWIIKVDNQGNKVWDKTFGGSGIDLVYSAIAVSDGGYLLGGFSESDASGDKSENSLGSADYWILRIDNQGNKLWDKTFGGSGGDGIRNLIATSDGGWLLFGNSDSDISGDKSENSKGSGDYWVLKIDNRGNKIWDKTIGGSESDNLTFTILTADGGYLLAGYSHSNASGDKSENNRGNGDYWIVKLDAGFNKVWDKTFGGSNSDSPNAISKTSDGGYLVGGTSNSNASGDKSENGKGSWDLWVVKIDAGGNQVWDKTLGGSNSDELASIILTAHGNHIASGSSDSNASEDKSENSKGGYDYWIVELKLPSAPSVMSFMVMNAQTDQEIKELKDGDVISLTEVGTSLLDIRANITDENINKVTFDLSGPITHHQTELVSPYALFGNNRDDFKGKKLVPGEYTLTVTPFINDKEQSPVTISFAVVHGISFTLMNAHTNQQIKELKDGDNISLTEVGTRLLDIRANVTADKIKKVTFHLHGPVTHNQTELVPPYALFGDIQGDFNGRKLVPGAYTLTVTPYIDNTKMPALTISFTVTDGFAITGFTLIDATLDKPVGELSQGDVIDLSLIGDHKLGVRADSEPMHLDKVDFTLQGPVRSSNTERVYPYVLFGDITQNGYTDYTGAKLFPGTYRLTATPYAGGVMGTRRTITFEVIKGGGGTAFRLVEVYPIPASGVINIKHEEETEQAHITLLDFHGNVLLNRPLSQEPVEQLDVSAFRNGIHYLKVISPEGSQIIRLVFE